MDGWRVGVEEDGENPISTCGCKDANARLDECCLWEMRRAVIFRCTSEKTRCPGGQKCRVAKDCRSVASTVWTAWRSGRRKLQSDIPPTIARRQGGFVRGCTSLPCTSGTVRTPCPVKLRTGIREQNGKWNGIKAKRARSHISSRVWSCTCSNRCLARCGCL